MTLHPGKLWLLAGEMLFVGGILSYDTATSSAELFR